MGDQDFVFVVTAVDYKRLSDAAFKRQMTVAEFVQEAITKHMEEPEEIEESPVVQYEAKGRLRKVRRS